MTDTTTLAEIEAQLDGVRTHVSMGDSREAMLALVDVIRLLAARLPADQPDYDDEISLEQLAAIKRPADQPEACMSGWEDYLSEAEHLRSFILSSNEHDDAAWNERLAEWLRARDQHVKPCVIPEATAAFAHEVGDHLRKTEGYRYEGVIVAKFFKLRGGARYVVEATHPVNEGQLFIFNETQLAKRIDDVDAHLDAIRNASQPVAGVLVPEEVRAWARDSTTKRPGMKAARDWINSLPEPQPNERA